MDYTPIPHCHAPCANILCAQFGCQRAKGYQPPLTFQPQPRGCICPPTSEQTCEADYCPRKSAMRPKDTQGGKG